MHVAAALHTLFSAKWDTSKLDALLKHPATRDAILADQQPDAIVASWQSPKCLAIPMSPILR